MPTTYAQDRLTDLYQHGGFTYDPLFGEVPQYGWAVGLPGHEEIIPLARITAADIDRHARSLPPSAYQGGWVKDGDVYLDAVQLEPDRVDAVRLGIRHHQLAVYNLRSGETLDLVAIQQEVAA